MKNRIEYVLPDWTLSALVNNDWSGLDEPEAKRLRSFLDSIPGYSFLCELEHEGFLHGNDLDGYASNCVTVVFVK